MVCGDVVLIVSTLGMPHAMPVGGVMPNIMPMMPRGLMTMGLQVVCASSVRLRLCACVCVCC
jgi:hypothetical protein